MARPLYNFLIDRGKLHDGETAIIFGASGALGALSYRSRNYRERQSWPLPAPTVARPSPASLAPMPRSTTAPASRRTGHGADERTRCRSGVRKQRRPGTLAPCARCVAQAGPSGELRRTRRRQCPARSQKALCWTLQIIGAAGVNVSDLDWALAAGARGDISATIDRVFPLERAAEAQDYVERERPLGKVLIAPGRGFENFGKSGHRHELRISAAAQPNNLVSQLPVGTQALARPFGLQ